MGGLLYPVITFIFVIWIKELVKYNKRKKNMKTNNEENEVRTIRKFCPYCKDIHDVIPRGCLLVQRVDNKFISEYECTNCGRKFRKTEERYS